MKLSQSIPLTSIPNARELGGYQTADGKTVKAGALLRTAQLSQATNADLQTLRDTYRLQYIADFRMDMEIPGMEDPAIEGAQYHHLSVIDPMQFGEKTADFDMSGLDILEIVDITVQAGMMDERMYIGFLSQKMGKKAYADFFRLLLDADLDRAVLWHCTSGKDRTGLAAMLLLSALGVDESVIISDFLLTNAYYAPRIEGTKQLLRSKGCDDDYIERGILVFDAVDERFMRNAIEFLKKTYGSVIGYIRQELGLTQEDINSLKEKYLV